jgi:drug/metabolite transporter (DMT)-like permease
MSKLSGKVMIAFLAVYLFWGGTYVGIKLGLTVFPPLGMAAIRHSIAGLMMLGVALWRKERWPTFTQGLTSMIIGVLMLTIGNGLVTFAEQTVPSAIVSLLIGAVPLWIIVLNWALGDHRTPTLYALLGVVLGLVGIAVLVFSAQRDASFAFSWWGIGLVMTASLSWAGGSLMSRYGRLPNSALMNLAIQMLTGGMTLAILSTLRQEWLGFNVDSITPTALWALLYLIFLGSLVAYSAYLWLLRHVNPTWVSTYAFVNPIVAVILGWLLAGEQLTPMAGVAAVIIVVSIAVMTLSPKTKPKR